MADFVERFRLKSSYRICILVSETGSRACWRQSIEHFESQYAAERSDIFYRNVEGIHRGEGL